MLCCAFSTPRRLTSTRGNLDASPSLETGERKAPRPTAPEKKPIEGFLRGRGLTRGPVEEARATPKARSCSPLTPTSRGRPAPRSCQEVLDPPFAPSHAQIHAWATARCVGAVPLHSFLHSFLPKTARRLWALTVDGITLWRPLRAGQPLYGTLIPISTAAALRTY